MITQQNKMIAEFCDNVGVCRGWFTPHYDTDWNALLDAIDAIEEVTKKKFSIPRPPTYPGQPSRGYCIELTYKKVYDIINKLNNENKEK